MFKFIELILNYMIGLFWEIKYLLKTHHLGQNKAEAPFLTSKAYGWPNLGLFSSVCGRFYCFLDRLHGRM